MKGNLQRNLVRKLFNAKSAMHLPEFADQPGSLFGFETAGNFLAGNLEYGLAWEGRNAPREFAQLLGLTPGFDVESIGSEDAPPQWVLKFTSDKEFVLRLPSPDQIALLRFAIRTSVPELKDLEQKIMKELAFLELFETDPDSAVQLQLFALVEKLLKP